jgi:hypothetical protein
MADFLLPSPGKVFLAIARYRQCSHFFHKINCHTTFTWYQTFKKLRVRVLVAITRNQKFLSCRLFVVGLKKLMQVKQ